MGLHTRISFTAAQEGWTLGALEEQGKVLCGQSRVLERRRQDQH